MHTRLQTHDGGKRAYFEGWYFKHEGQGVTLALIPGVRTDQAGHRAAFLQVVTDGAAWMVDYPERDFAYDAAADAIRLGESRFSPRGMQLCVHAPGLDLEGRVDYGQWTPLRYDIMGPFRMFPAMECRHSVFSLRHRLDGRVRLNGQTLCFDEGVGYVEGDRGRSFPGRYAWTQASDAHARRAVMVSVADIPYLGLRFRGCIAVALVDGRQYRLATYKGVRVARCAPDGLILRQGRLTLTAQRLDGAVGQGLRAPVSGAMGRIIHENAACPMRFGLWEGGRQRLDLICPRASYEYVT